ncbi:MAG: glycosyltransferase family A protein [Candidatus Saccharibacteria bacterium]|nr:glycosyltransferase family A protein [Candidatus Saccharibacteria bacterium]
MKSPTISIIVPAYNAEKTIADLIVSILDQDFLDFELIIVNDGSTDNTKDIVRELSKGDSRIVLVNKKNGGPSSARNIGIKYAKGRFIQFYDSDDLVMPGALSTMTSAILTSDASVVISGWGIKIGHSNAPTYKTIQPEPQLITEDVVSFVLKSLGDIGTLYNLWNKLFVAKIIKKNNLKFREGLRFGEDVVFFLDYLPFADSIQIISQPTYQYVESSSTSIFGSSALDPNFRLENDKAIVEFAKSSQHQDIASLLSWLRWRWLISYWMMISGSKITRDEKVQRLRHFTLNDKPHKTPSLSKNILLFISWNIKLKPGIILLFAGALSGLKKLIKQAKLFVSKVSGSQPVDV